MDFLILLQSTILGVEKSESSVIAFNEMNLKSSYAMQDLPG